MPNQALATFCQTNLTGMSAMRVTRLPNHLHRNMVPTTFFQINLTGMSAMRVTRLPNHTHRNRALATCLLIHPKGKGIADNKTLDNLLDRRETTQTQLKTQCPNTLLLRVATLQDNFRDKLGTHRHP